MPGTTLAVVISTYNQPGFLRLTLEGYRRQTDRNYCIYIADDGSSEATGQLIERMQRDFPVPIHHIRQSDHGFRKARIHNRVIAQVRETQTLLSDGDCIPPAGLVAAHRRYAGDDYFVSGSRVLLSRNYTEQLCKQPAFASTERLSCWLKRRLRGQVNRLLPLLLPPSLGPASQQLKGIRGCHLACPTAALRRINGFDESFEGWGREDSDLVARLLHAGLSRRNLRGQPVLHLWHPESSRQQLADNDEILQACLHEKRIEALQGIKQLHEKAGAAAQHG